MNHTHLRRVLRRLHSEANGAHTYTPVDELDENKADARSKQEALEELEGMNYVERREMQPRVLARRRSRRYQPSPRQDGPWYRITREGRDWLREFDKSGQGE